MHILKNVPLPVLVVMLTGLCSEAFQYQTCSPYWKEHGCKVDYHHNLTLLIDDRHLNASVKINWDNLNGYVHDLMCRCRTKAKTSGYSLFAINKDGICFSASGALSDYLKLNPLDSPDKCNGTMNIISSNAPDGSACVPGVHRVYFYTIEQPPAPPQSSPQASPEQEEEEEEKASSPGASHGEQEEKASSPGASPGEEEEEAVVPSPPQQEVIVNGSCRATIDALLIIDLSGSVGYSHFAIEQKFAKEFVRRYYSSTSRIGIMTYDDNITSLLTWEQSSHMNQSQIESYIDGIVYTGGSTLTQIALTYAKDLVVKPHAREGVNATIIIMTDGKTFRGTSSLETPARELRDLNCNMIAIGVGADYDVKELLEITGQRSDRVIEKSSFNSLGEDISNVMTDILNKSCF